MGNKERPTFKNSKTITSHVGVDFGDNCLSRKFEIVRLNDAVTAINVEAYMPPGWQLGIMEIVESKGKLVELPGGKVSTSMEKSDFTTVYKVVKGEAIKENLPWLFDLYQGKFREIVSEVAKKLVEPDGDEKFGININTITKETQKDGYELHTDINPWTGLLSATTMNVGDGGELVLLSHDGKQLKVRPKAGWLYVFDGRNHPHRVEPLTPDASSDIRITVPMDYVNLGWHPNRPIDMDAIFGNGGK